MGSSLGLVSNVFPTCSSIKDITASGDTIVSFPSFLFTATLDWVLFCSFLLFFPMIGCTWFNFFPLLFVFYESEPKNCGNMLFAIAFFPLSKFVVLACIIMKDSTVFRFRVADKRLTLHLRLHDETFDEIHKMMMVE